MRLTTTMTLVLDGEQTQLSRDLTREILEALDLILRQLMLVTIMEV